MANSPVETLGELLRQRRESMPRTVDGLRAEFERMMGLFPVDPAVHREPAMPGGVSAEWFTPQDVVPGRVLLYLHGGGYILGSTQTHASLIANVATAARARTLALNYRLAPEHRHPAAVEDATAAYRWLLEQGVDPARLAVAGDSAGGGLSLALLLSARDAGWALPAAAVCLSPWTDLAGTGDSLDTRAQRDPMLDKKGVFAFARMTMGDQDPRLPLASPLYAPLAGLPPLLIQVGGAEILFDDSSRLAARAQEAGTEVTLQVWDDMIHVFHIYSTMVAEAREAIEKIGVFLDEKLMA